LFLSIVCWSRGLFGFDESTGFWLAHSAPGFPYSHDISPSSWSFNGHQVWGWRSDRECVSILLQLCEFVSHFLGILRAAFLLHNF
jgi:hypothetical protein